MNNFFFLNLFVGDGKSKFMKMISLYFPPLASLDYTNNQHKRFSDLFFSLVGWMSDGMTVMNGGWYWALGGINVS